MKIWLSVICEKQNKFEIQLFHISSFDVPLQEKKLLEKLTRVSERLICENLQQQFVKCLKHKLVRKNPVTQFQIVEN